jgi:acetoin utilization protein AcuB
MSRDPITCRADDPLLDAVARMSQHRVRHLPVLDERREVIGMLSDREIRAALGDRERRTVDVVHTLDGLLVSGAMSSPPLTIPLDMSLADAVALLVKHEVGALPVIDDFGRLAGIVYSVDVLRALGSGPNAPARRRTGG